MLRESAKRIIVTGGAGFLGSHLCERLLKQGHEVICIDNFYTGRKINLVSFASHPNFELIRHDIVQPIFVEADEIFNLACAASPVHYQKHPVQTLRTSVEGIINMLGIAKRLGIRVMQSSTSEVYGDPEVHPQREDYVGHVDPLSIRACYDEGKRCAETLCMDYHRQYGVEVKIARIFNTYGPRMLTHDGRVVSNFIVQALRGEDITVYGDGSQTRSFCFYSDMIEGFLKLMASEEGITGPINLGNPVERTVLETAELVIKHTKSKSKIVHKPLPPADPTRRRPDISLAKTKLGWEPKIDFEDGLMQTIEYFKSMS